MTKTFLLAGAALVALGMGTAVADTFTQSVNFPGPGATVGPTDFINATGTTSAPNTTQLYYFDSNGGTLTSITFTYNYAFSSSINVSSSTPSSGTVRTESGAQFGSDSTAVTAALNRVVNSDAAGVSFGGRTLAPVAADVLGSNSSYNFTAANGGNANFTSQGNAGNLFVDTNAADLTAFSQAGGGFFTPLFNTLTGLVTSTSGGNAQLSQTTVATAGLTITYTYTVAPPPPVGVPEPASMALLGAGLVGLGVFRRRRG